MVSATVLSFPEVPTVAETPTGFQQAFDLLKLFIAATLALLGTGLIWMVRRTSSAATNEKLEAELVKVRLEVGQKLDTLKAELERRILSSQEIRLTVREIAVTKDSEIEARAREAGKDAHKAKNIALVLVHEIIHLREAAGLPEKDFSALLRENDT